MVKKLSPTIVYQSLVNFAERLVEGLTAQKAFAPSLPIASLLSGTSSSCRPLRPAATHSPPSPSTPSPTSSPPFLPTPHNFMTSDTVFVPLEPPLLRSGQKKRKKVRQNELMVFKHKPRKGKMPKVQKSCQSMSLSKTERDEGLCGQVPVLQGGEGKRVLSGL